MLLSTNTLKSKNNVLALSPEKLMRLKIKCGKLMTQEAGLE